MIKTTVYHYLNKKGRPKPMSQNIRELIREARSEMRRASGLPLTAEEQSEESRRTLMNEMNKFIVESLGFRLMFPLKSDVIWTNKGAAAQLTVEGRIFHIRKDGDQYGLFSIEEHQEQEIVKMEGSDPQFANRVLIAIGETLPTP